MADFKKLKDGQGNSYNVKDETARTNLSSHTSNTSNPHSVTKSQVGLGNCDNTSDLNKPVSTATQTALGLKIDKSSIKTSTPENPSNDDVPSIKYLEDTFAKITEFYETLGCGYALLADNLDTKLTINDQLAYIQRTTAGGEEVANTCKVHSIIGGSLGWNQLVQNGNFTDTSGWNVSTITSFTVANNKGTVVWTPVYSNNGLEKSNFVYNKDHVYFITCTVKNLSSDSRSFYIGQSYGERLRTGSLATNATIISSGIIKVTTVEGNGYNTFRLGADSTLNIEYSAEFSNAMLVDLTACFGSTIADYIYSLETATTGSGVACFKRYFPKDYYPYKAIGGFEHVKISGKRYTGFNQWDEQTQSGYYDISTGQRVTSAQHIMVYPNTA